MSDLVLYNYFRSSTSYRARIALHLKALSFEYKPVHLLNDGGEQHKPEYRKYNPAGEVPTLVHGQKVIAQSMAIVQYLDEIFPETLLLPKDHYEKAKVLQIAENINCGHALQNLKVLQFLEKKFEFSEDDKQTWMNEWLGRILSSTEQMVQQTAKKYAFGDQVTVADIFIVPQLFSARRFKIDLSPYKTLMKIDEACAQHPAFEKAHPMRQIDTPSEMKV